MSKETYSNEELVQIFESEGIAYAIQNYLNLENIEDDEIRDLAGLVQYGLNKIEALLEI